VLLLLREITRHRHSAKNIGGLPHASSIAITRGVAGSLQKVADR
jgi:hypothetical protein